MERGDGEMGKRKMRRKETEEGREGDQKRKGGRRKGSQNKREGRKDEK